MRNKRSILLAICFLFLVLSLPTQISASDTLSSDFCAETSAQCTTTYETRYECRNNDTWEITIVTTRCPDGSTETRVSERRYLIGQCPYGGPAY